MIDDKAESRKSSEIIRENNEISAYCELFDEVKNIWELVFQNICPIDALISLSKLAQKNYIICESYHVHFLISVYRSDYRNNDFDVDSIRASCSLYLASLFAKEPQKMQLFIESGLIQIVMPLFPRYKVPSFMFYCIDESYFCGKYLIENNFIPNLIELVMVMENVVRLGKNDLINVLRCAGNLCDFDEFENHLLQLAPVFNAYAMNCNGLDEDPEIKAAAIHGFAILLKKSEKATEFFLASNLLNSILSYPDLLNQSYLEAICNLVGSLLNHINILDDSIISMSFQVLFNSLLNNEEYNENCLCLIADSIADAAKSPLATKKCLELKFENNITIFELLYKRYSEDSKWNLKIHIFDAILSIFSNSDAQYIDFFVGINFFDFLLENIVEMTEYNGFAILSALDFINVIAVNTNNENIKDFLFSKEIEDVLQILSGSQDFEIKIRAQAVKEKIDISS